MTAIQDHAQMGDLFIELLIDLPGGLGSGARQGAARKKDSMTSSRQAVAGKEPRTAAAFVSEDIRITPGREFAAGHNLTAHLQKKVPWCNLGRADCCAEITQAALKGINCGISSQQRRTNVTWCAVFLEKCALGDTSQATGTCLIQGLSLMLDSDSQGRLSVTGARDGAGVTFFHLYFLMTILSSIKENIRS